MGNRFRGRVILYVPDVQSVITTYPFVESVYLHPHSYQAPVQTQNASYKFYICRNGTDLDVFRCAHSSSTWALASSITVGLSTAQGDMASIAVDSSGNIHIATLISTGSYNIIWKKSTDNGSTWSSDSTVATGANWGSAGVSGPCIHIDPSDHVHVAYADEGSNYAYHAYHNGSSWTNTRVTTDGSGSLRPYVITTAGGRVVYSFTNSSNQCEIWYSDNNGSSWTEASPTTTGAAACFNITLGLEGSIITVAAQQTSGTRTLIMNECDATTMSWGSWEVIKSGTGADITIFYDSNGYKNAVYRHYPTGAYYVYWATKASGSWVETQIGSSVDHILPKVCVNPHHRFAPTYNKPWVIMPESAGNVNSRFITSIDMAA